MDVSRGIIRAERNLGRYALFVCFFPQIIQGPIPRYGDLAGQLYEGYRFDEKEFVKGAWLVLWGFFLKLMIADRAGTAVNTIFGGWEAYQGGLCSGGRGIVRAGALYGFSFLRVSGKGDSFAVWDQAGRQFSSSLHGKIGKRILGKMASLPQFVA